MGSLILRVRRRVLRFTGPRLRREWRAQYGGRLTDWLYYHHRTMLKEKQVTWFGVPTVRSVWDTWIYQEIVAETRPALIIEIGSDAGGLTLFFAHLLDLLDIADGRVLSIDITRERWQVSHPRIDMLTGSSGDPAIVAAAFAAAQNRRTLVLHDGDHHSEAVLRDLRAYADCVSLGSYFIVEDGIADVFVPGLGLGQIRSGPLVACRRFLAERPDFVAYRARERYRVTYNPMGYLRRVGRP